MLALLLHTPEKFSTPSYLVYIFDLTRQEATLYRAPVPIPKLLNVTNKPVHACQQQLLPLFLKSLLYVMSLLAKPVKAYLLNKPINECLSVYTGFFGDKLWHYLPNYYFVECINLAPSPRILRCLTYHASLASSIPFLSFFFSSQKKAFLAQNAGLAILSPWMHIPSSLHISLITPSSLPVSI